MAVSGAGSRMVEQRGLIVFRDEGVQAVIACALLLLNSHITEEVEIEVDEEEMD